MSERARVSEWSVSECVCGLLASPPNEALTLGVSGCRFDCAPFQGRVDHGENHLRTVERHNLGFAHGSGISDKMEGS